MILADDVIVEYLAYLLRSWNTVPRFRQRGRLLLADYVHVQFDALVANEDRWPGNELTYLALALAAERAVERVLRIVVADLAHFRASTRCESSQLLPPTAIPLLEGRPSQLGFPSTLMIHRARVPLSAMRFCCRARARVIGQTL